MGKVCNVAMPIESANGISVNRSKHCHASNYTNSDNRKVEYIVMHYTGNIKDNAKNNANYFMGSNRHASAHYFVDDDSIWQSVDTNDVAWHCGTTGTYYHSSCRNKNSIGIEMCCTAGNYKIGNKAIENAAQLVAALCKYFDISDVDKYIVRHYDITRKHCPGPMVGSNNASWTAFKDRVKKLINPESKPQDNIVIGAGDKLSLSNVAIYGSSSAKTKAGNKTGTYYVWSAPVINNRIRITNSVDRVGKSGQVTGWIDVDDAKKALSTEVDAPKSYKVKVVVGSLNIRSGPSTSYKINGKIADKGVYTIVEAKGNWGKLKSGAGWIYLKGYTKKV